MKKWVNILHLIEVLLYIVVVAILFTIEGEQEYSLYFTMIYWGTVFIVNMSYYTYNFIKYKKTPQISIYSPTAIIALMFSLGGMSFVTIKNRSYRELIKSANNSETMSKQQRLKAYVYYLLLWVALGLGLLFVYLDDLSRFKDGVDGIAGIMLLFIFLILIYRIFMFYDFAGKREVKK